jgi:hypothetical protein
MKDITLFFAVTAALSKAHVHWVGAQLLASPQALFREVLEQAVVTIEAQVLAGVGPCPWWGGPPVQNGWALRRVRRCWTGWSGRGCGGGAWGVGRISQQTFVDPYAKPGCATLGDRETPLTAADPLNDRELLFHGPVGATC